jgi:DNA-binding response OmpR family regulator
LTIQSKIKEKWNMANILVVDSAKPTSEFVSKILSKYGHRVSASSSVDSALQWLEDDSNEAHLIIVDVGIREFQGLEFVELLKTRHDLQKIPVLVQTKGTNCDFFSFCDGSLRKPYSGKDLLDQVDLLIRGMFSGG